jgi:hypothetical protein
VGHHGRIGQPGLAILSHAGRIAGFKVSSKSGQASARRWPPSMQVIRMNDIVQVIAAVAALVTSIAGVVLAVAKLGPFINAWNKYCADTHKRVKEASNKAKDQSPSSMTPKSPTVALTRRQLAGVVVFAASSFAIMVYESFAVSELKPITLVTCLMAATNISMAFMFILTATIVQVIMNVVPQSVESEPPRSTH